MRKQRHRAKVAPAQLVAEALYKGNIEHTVGTLESRAFNLAIPRPNVACSLIDEGLYQVAVRT